MEHKSWQQQAKQALKLPNYPAYKLQLIHTAVASGLSVALTAISFLLPMLVGADGGLGALGIQSVVTTVQTVLPFLTVIFGIFWNVGMQRSALCYAQDQETGPRDLPEGFRFWKPVLSSSLSIFVQYLFRGMVAAFVSSQLLAFTPYAGTIYKASLQQVADPTLDMMALLGDSIDGIMLTYGAIFAVVFAALALPVYYRYRMTNFVILENPELGGMRAMLYSRMMTHRKRMKLLKLDLQFWWFYGLELLITALCYGDVILNAVGVKLPISADLASWVFLLAALAAQLLLYCLAKPWLEVSFAKAYGTLVFQMENPEDTVEAETVVPTGKNHPWDD